ncbi:MAG: hypothetical protein PV340_03330 [Wolbachia sp.]|nr:hypothetical protein [Wolbachia sp.]
MDRERMCSKFGSRLLLKYRKFSSMDVVRKFNYDMFDKIFKYADNKLLKGIIPRKTLS